MTRFRWMAVVSFVALASLLVGAQQVSIEYDVKAAFVLNFVRFVEWPPSHQQPPLRVCVMQPSPFGERLAAAVAGEQWQGDAIQVRVVPDVRAASDCHLLYVPAAAAARFTATRPLLMGQPLLTVGEHERFLSEGGVIHLFMEDNRVRFSINRQSAEMVGLRISSRLLRLARCVIGAPRT
jgi:hypothetical protein